MEKKFLDLLLVSYLDRPVTARITAARPRLIYDLARGLLKRGHRVSLLGTGDSKVPGVRVIPVIPRALNMMPAFENPFHTHTVFLSRMARMLRDIAPKFDVIHNHCRPETINLLVEKDVRTPVVTTIHSEITPERDTVFSEFKDSFFVCISRAARRLARKTKIRRVVYNGVDTRLYAFRDKKDDYVLWIGRLSKAKNKDGSFMDPKGVRHAIALARETDSRLLLSGNVEDPEFFEKDVKPYLNKKVQWVGPLSSEQALTKKQVVQLMQRAKAFLMTVNWHEPFGLVMAEAQSCGTPVIGFDRGSVSELIQDGKTGFVVPSRAGVAGLKRALSRVSTIDPKACREHAVQKFSTERMVEEYEAIYKELCA